MKLATKLTRGIFKVVGTIRKDQTTIMSCAAVAGTIATAILTAKGTVKAMTLWEELNSEEKEQPVARAIIFAKSYAPALAVGAGTAICILGTNALNLKRQASLLSAYSLAASSLKEYKNKVGELYGNDVEAKVNEEIANDYLPQVVPEDERPLYYEPIGHRYFNAKPEDVVSAEYCINRRFKLRGYATLNEFYELLELEPMRYGDLLGWSEYMGVAFYGYQWIDFEHVKVVTEDGLEYTVIDMPFMPTGDIDD